MNAERAQLERTLTDHYLGLLPDGRRAGSGTVAERLVQALAALGAGTAVETITWLFDGFPSVASAAALAEHGRSRSLTRYPGEPLDVFRRRVCGALEFWRHGGTLVGVRLALEQAGYRAVITEHGRDDEDRDHWAEFSVTVAPFLVQRSTAQWDRTDAYDGTATWDYKLPATPLSALLDLIRDVKPARSRLRRLLFSPNGFYWDSPTATYPLEAVIPAPWGAAYGMYAFADPTPDLPTWDETEMLVVYEMETL